ncbi:MAG TPA: TerB family tellurite resistance protein [Kofleriaceae bacterium]|nr:TerB family tellurite resistance protein [Kofleriaceae bacterium]
MRRNQIVTTPEDTILLLHGMMVMSDFQSAPEAAMLDLFLQTLPEFRLEDTDDLKAKVRAIRARYPSAKDSIAELARMSSDVLKKKTFILAMDIALASGAIDATEDELLEELRSTLGIDLGTAEQVLELLAIKYAS